MSSNLKIYFAGSWANREFIKKNFIEPAILKGYIITHDWTLMETGKRNIATQKNCAEADVKGVMDADIIVAVMNEPQSLQHAYRGTFFELGMAYALQKRILLFVPNPMTQKNEITNEIEITNGLAQNVFLWLRRLEHYSSIEVINSVLEAEQTKNETFISEIEKLKEENKFYKSALAALM